MPINTSGAALSVLGTVAGAVKVQQHLKQQKALTEAQDKLQDYEDSVNAPVLGEQLNKEFSDLQTKEKQGTEQEATLNANLLKSNNDIKKLEESLNSYKGQFTDLNTPQGKLLGALGMAKTPTSGQRGYITRQNKKLESMYSANASLQDEIFTINESNKKILDQKDALMKKIEKAQGQNKYLSSYLSSDIDMEQMYGKGGKK